MLILQKCKFKSLLNSLKIILSRMSQPPAYSYFAQGTDLFQTSHGESHVLLLDNKGNVYAEGSNSKGQLGNGSIIPSSYPIKIAIPERTIQVSAFDNSSLALGEFGNVYCWGYVSTKRGLFTSEDQYLVHPTYIANNIKKIACGKFYHLGIDSEQNIKFFANTILSKNLVTTVYNIECQHKFSQISCSTNRNMATNTQGSLYVWEHFSLIAL